MHHDTTNKNFSLISTATFMFKKVKYIDKEVNINVVPLPKKVEVVESNKYILLPKKIKVFIDSNETKKFI